MGRKAPVLALAAVAVLGATAVPAAHAATPAAAPAAKAKKLAKTMVKDDKQFACFSKIVEHESHWDHTAQNASSGAYGLVQALPGNKMASEGADWRTNPETQLKWGLDYMKERYGSPCGAWDHWQKNRWY
ncbi:transglycosylase SLT domain-containing protein [Streptomyces sp. A7024]|uniref:Transglycosylase SLT domain-containing protein n=2 Tax=Streptomyces coryli TaxID=1128680 RepID=A0A6G4U775_9ACTN|nr:transglycosylase SLT domain-containing protein [Streptomyces coryli]